MLAVFGLGNPGAAYAATRHNVGFMVVDELLRRARARARRGSGDFDAAQVELAGIAVLLVKPMTYMNRCGRAARQLLDTQALAPADLLVVVDDVYLPFGRLRLRLAGSAGGHNGLSSLVESLSTSDFPRLRLGVGTPAGETPLTDHVLGGFSPEETSALPDFVSRAADAVERVAQLGVERAMPAVNGPAAEAAEP